MVKFFKIFLRKFSPPHRSTLLCSNVIKFVRREIGEILRYSRDQKMDASETPYCTDRAQNLPGPQHLAHTVPDFIQIGSLSTKL